MTGCCNDGHKSSGTSTREYKIGGMKHIGAEDEVIDTLSHIEGVKQVKVDKSNQNVFIEYYPEKVSEEHLISTLNSLGHSILN